MNIEIWKEINNFSNYEIIKKLVSILNVMSYKRRIQMYKYNK